MCPVQRRPPDHLRRQRRCCRACAGILYVAYLPSRDAVAGLGVRAARGRGGRAGRLLAAGRARLGVRRAHRRRHHAGHVQRREPGRASRCGRTSSRAASSWRRSSSTASSRRTPKRRTWSTRDHVGETTARESSGHRRHRQGRPDLHPAAAGRPAVRSASRCARCATTASCRRRRAWKWSRARSSTATPSSEAMTGVTHVLHLATSKETPESIMDVAVKGMFWLLEACRTQPDVPAVHPDRRRRRHGPLLLPAPDARSPRRRSTAPIPAATRCPRCWKR